MADIQFTFLKFACELIDAGIWAKMSPAARTLYPVLLRFTDKHFSPVYPGSKTLLELTGFKQKSSLRKARNELVELGLISVTTGSGRKNTVYHFRFDWIPRRGKSTYPRGGTEKHPPEGINKNIQNAISEPSQGSRNQPPYNQIQISIHNHPDISKSFSKHPSKPRKEKSRDEFQELRRQYGSRNVELAISEAKLAGLPIHAETIQMILSRNSHNEKLSFEMIISELKDKISDNSLQKIQEAFLKEDNGFLIFSDILPLYLKNILYRLTDHILFEPVPTQTNLAIREAWR